MTQQAAAAAANELEHLQGALPELQVGREGVEGSVTLRALLAAMRAGAGNGAGMLGALD